MSCEHCHWTGAFHNCVDVLRERMDTLSSVLAELRAQNLSLSDHVSMLDEKLRRMAPRREP